MAVPEKQTVRALLGSLVVHALAAAAIVRASAAHPGETPEPAGIEVDLWSPPAPVAEPPEPHAPSPTPAHGSRVESAASAETPRSNPPPSGELRNAAPAGSSDPSSAWSFGRTLPSAMGDLGIGSYWKSLASDRSLAAPATTGEAASEQPSPPTPAEILRDGLEEHDRALGLGRGALISAVHDAVSGSAAPDVGNATIEVDSDSEGRVVSARVVSAAAEVASWNAVAQQIMRLMASKSIHPTRDGRGLRTRLRVVAERVLPSGTKYARGTGPALPDDACVGQADRRLGGLGRRCSTGLPAGASQGFDVADIGAKPSRVVHVQLQGEAPL